MISSETIDSSSLLSKNSKPLKKKSSSKIKKNFINRNDEDSGNKNKKSHVSSKKFKGNESSDLIVNEKGSIELGKECLQWMISPCKAKPFMLRYWEKQPLYIQRQTKDYYKHIFSCKAFDELLRNSDRPMIFGKVNKSWNLRFKCIKIYLLFESKKS